MEAENCKHRKKAGGLKKAGKKRRGEQRRGQADMRTLIHKLPGLRMCWILPGTSMDLNLAGRSAALWGMCRSPNANTNTIF